MMFYINDNSLAGIYIRLSREDDDKVYESESITNQRSLLLQYAKENNINIYDIYIDDGYSGTNFDRPEFKRMIEDIENNKINIVLTKDMSRLGRDYIGTGNLIEKYFPEHNIRFIAVTDNIDTYLDNSNNDIAPFKAIMNDMYAKDISKKIKSSLRAKQKEGKWVGGRPPFGYDIDPKNKNHLVINKAQAIIVKRIYSMFLEGNTYFKIAKILTTEKIKTPAQYYRFEWKGNYNKNYGKWSPKTIEDILKNQNYTGDLVQNKRNKINYKIKKIKKNNPKDYIIVENTHEAIISKDTFEYVRKQLPKTVGRPDQKEKLLLDGLLYCGNCNHRISIKPRRKKDNRCYTICNYYRTYIKEKVCTMHSNNYDVMEKIILEKLKELCLQNIDKNKIQRNVINKLNNIYINDYEEDFQLIESEIKRLKDMLDTLYIDKLSNKIDDEQFNRIKTKLNNELCIKNKLLSEYKSNNSKGNHITNEQIEKYISEFLTMNKLSRQLIINLIERIEIFEDKTINIKLTF